MTSLLNQTFEGAEETLGTLFACSASGEESPTYALCEMGTASPYEGSQYLRWTGVLGGWGRKIAGIAHILSAPSTNLYIRGYVWFEGYADGNSSYNYNQGCLGIWKSGRPNSFTATAGFALGMPKVSDHRIFIGQAGSLGYIDVMTLGPEVSLGQWYQVDIHVNNTATTLHLDGVLAAVFNGDLLYSPDIEAVWTGLIVGDLSTGPQPVRFDHLQASSTQFEDAPPPSLAFKVVLS